MIDILKILFILITKGVPFLEEIIFKDRTLIQFLSDHITNILYLLIIVVLAATLVNTRIKYNMLLVSRESASDETIVMTAVPEEPMEPKKKPTDNLPLKKPDESEDETERQRRNFLQERLGY